MKASLADSESAVSPWWLAWLLLAPFALTLLVSKIAKFMAVMVWLGGSPNTRFIWEFMPFRVAYVVVVAIVLQRVLIPTRRYAAVPIAVALVVAAGAYSAFSTGKPILDTLHFWTKNTVAQVWMTLATTWSDAISVAMLVLCVGALLFIAPARLAPWLAKAVQAVVAALCVLVAIDYVYQLTTGQPTNTRVLLFAAANARDVMPLVRAEATPFRLLVIAGSLFMAVAWAWHLRRKVHMPLKRARRPDIGLAAAAVVSSAAFFPAPTVGFLEIERHSEGTLAGFLKSMKPLPLTEIRARALEDFVQRGETRWHTANLRLAPTDATRQRNVVIILMESVRAASTSLRLPALDTTPYLKRLADRSTQVDDMSAVIPRTAAAWVASLTGQYPLTNDGTALWAKERKAGSAPLRGLPLALREHGYATSYFSPANTEFLDDTQVLDAIGFESVYGEKQLQQGGTEHGNYFGLADEVMVQPILEWTAVQAKASRPFMTTIMTNVGHHDYATPPSWKKIQFEGVADPMLNAYYNCLRYVDGVIAQIMDGYERLGVIDNTIFVIMGDHGQMFGEHGLRQTYNAIYEEGLRVPALLYAPGLLPPGGRIGGPRQQIDILPTLAELLGYRLEGASLPGVSLLSEPDSQRRLYFSSTVDWTYLAARQGQRKYIYSFDRAPMEVYDLDEDPSELRPLKNVDARELALIQQDMLKWKVDAEVSMYGTRVAEYVSAPYRLRGAGQIPGSPKEH